MTRSPHRPRHQPSLGLSPRRPILLASASETPNNRDVWSQIIQVSAGAVAGLVNTLVLSPLDVVKTRLQVQGSTSFTATNYRGIVHALHSMFKEEGVRSYYRGLSASLWAFVPNWAIYWYAYETFKRTYTRNGKKQTPLIHVISAVSAGGITAVTTAPFWTLKARLQVDMTSSLSKRRYKSVPHGFQKIIREEGVSGLYKGLIPTLFGLGHVAVQFPLYEHIKGTLSGGRPEDAKAGHVLAASSISKAVASAIFYPHEVVRTRVQVDTSVLRYNKAPARMVQIIGDIFKKDGLGGFYRGFGANLVRTVPACMLTFTSYELIKRFAEQRAVKRKGFDLEEQKKELEIDSVLAKDSKR